MRRVDAQEFLEEMKKIWDEEEDYRAMKQREELRLIPQTDNMPSETPNTLPREDLEPDM